MGGMLIGKGWLYVILLLCLCSVKGTLATDEGAEGGWYESPVPGLPSVGPCNIDKYDAKDLTQQEFQLRFATNEPVVINGISQSHFRELCSKTLLRQKYGQFNIQLSAASTFSLKKIDVTVNEYLDTYFKPQNINQPGNETFYLFGDIDREQWADLLNEYKRPEWTLPDHKGELSFGLAGAGTGVPFHVHGPVFAEVIYGLKRWFLSAPGRKPSFDPDMSTLQWYKTEYNKLGVYERPWECTLGPNQLLYLPHGWWHATLNLQPSVFMSTFLSP